MGLRAQGSGRRVLLAGVAALVPAVLVTLLLVHQPVVGRRALAPMMRRPLAIAGLVLAAATVVLWAAAANRRRWAPLAGLAWAGVAVLLCVGPLVHSAPTPRLFAFDAGDGAVVWTSADAGSAPAMIAGDLVVTTADGAALVGLDPSTGEPRWRHPLDASAPMGGTPAEQPVTATWLTADEHVLTVVRTGATTYAYVTTPGADRTAGGALVSLGADGVVRWRRALPAAMTVQSTAAAIGADDRFVVVAGGERIGVLDAGDGHLVWSRSVVDLGKSRSFALDGAVQQVVVAESMVYLAVSAAG